MIFFCFVVGPRLTSVFQSLAKVQGVPSSTVDLQRPFQRKKKFAAICCCKQPGCTSSPIFLLHTFKRVNYPIATISQPKWHLRVNFILVLCLHVHSTEWNASNWSSVKTFFLCPYSAASTCSGIWQSCFVRSACVGLKREQKKYIIRDSHVGTRAPTEKAGAVARGFVFITLLSACCFPKQQSGKMISPVELPIESAARKPDHWRTIRRDRHKIYKKISFLLTS